MRIPLAQPISVVIGGMLVCACTSSGVLETNPGQYLVSATGTSPAFTGTEDAIEKVYSEANAKCAGQNQHVDTISLETIEQQLGRAGRATLKFRCVDAK